MMPVALRPNSERGSITVFFVLFLLVASAAVSYAVFVGRSAEEKMRTDTAADLSSLAMAQHAAMGLNMVAVNNLAIGGNLHIGASVPFLGRYYAVLLALYNFVPGDGTKVPENFCPTKTFSGSLAEATKMIKGGESVDETDYAEGFKSTKSITGLFIKNAAGMTSINVQVAKHWVKGSLVKGVEQLRLNKPGDVGLMVQASAIGSIADAASFYNMKFDHLALTSPKNTMCQTIKSSEAIGDRRNRVSLWLGGAVESVAGDSSVINTIEAIEGGLQSVDGEMSEQANNAKDSVKANVDRITRGLTCEQKKEIDELEPPLTGAERKELNENCDQLAKLESVSPGSFFPEFSGCGLTRDGDFGQMFENFTKAKSGEKTAIGFVFPNVNSSTVKAYEDSLQFAAAVGNPLYLLDETPTKSVDGVKTTACPDAWKTEVNGKQYCSLMLDGLDSGFASKQKDESDRDLASGGIGRAVGANGGGQEKGALNSIWARVQWSIGQAKAEYEPDTLHGDPDHAKMADENDFKNLGARANKRRMQFFWPAWKARSAQPTVLDGVLKMLGNG